MEKNCRATHRYDPLYHRNIYVCVCNATEFEIEDLRPSIDVRLISFFASMTI